MSRHAHIRRGLAPAEWRRAGALAAAIAGLHVIGFGTLLLAVVPRHFSLGHGAVFGLGLGITAYTLGLRHAFDADHIAAIDNTTRKLMSDGRRPLGVGFSFSLGHSTVVFGLTLLLALGLGAIGGQVENAHSTLHALTGIVGTGVSGAFLYLITAINVTILIAIARLLRAARSGRLDEAELERRLSSRGLINRLLGRFARNVSSSWQMYPVGVLFGLGFDTATEVTLLFLAAGAASSGLPFYALLCLPVLFAAGMTLFDTIDGSLMNFAYGWAFAEPVRRVYYNLATTALTVMVAFGVGTVELLAVVPGKLGLHGGFWAWAGSVDLGALGYFILALFVVSWLLSAAIWRFGRIGRRWPSRTQSA
jgi:high-affinity nickel-transport protein